VKKQYKGRYGVFGSTSPRFPTSKAHTESVIANLPRVGPGSYDPSSSSSNTSMLRRKEKRSPVFASTTPQTSPLGQVATAPPAGSYNLPDSWIKKSPSKYPLVSTSPRFQQGSDPADVPGPGHYAAINGTIEAKVRAGEGVHYRGIERNSGHVKFGQAPRFSEPLSDTPGPGYYDNGPGLIKRTFNITIGDWE